MSEHKILIANRGEIAVRILEASVQLGHKFVCVYTDSDKESGHVRRALELGGEVFKVSSYHDANEILSIADKAHATAIHPGYGFFAEDFRFARRVSQRTNKLIFIGPSWRVIRELGDKINTKRLARSLGVPTVPGSDKPIYDEMEAEKVARSLYDFQLSQNVAKPRVLVKASAGGGGMGIEEVQDIDMFRQVYRRIRNYALRQFKDEGVLIEQRVTDFNHLEVQVISDRTGKNPVHFGTRNCSIQSTGLQKRLEIAPGFSAENIEYGFDGQKVLNDIIAHSIAMAKEVGYDNVGTWEWIVARDGTPFLMEVNTRIQVENGVSGCIARKEGEEVNIIAEQIRIGLGEDLGYTQQDVSFEGIGIEYRLIAEDPANNFTPWVGTIERFNYKPEPWLHFHTHIPTDKPYEIPTDFDPNLALAIIWGKDLDEVKARGLDFLNNLVLEGKNLQNEALKSNVEFLKEKTPTILEFTATSH